MADRYCHNLSK